MLPALRDDNDDDDDDDDRNNEFQDYIVDWQIKLTLLPSLHTNLNNYPKKNKNSLNLFYCNQMKSNNEHE